MKKGIKSTVKFPTEIWDQMQFFFKEYNDHQLHCAIYFNDLLDIESIKKAILITMDIVPILGSRFVADKFRTYWEKVDFFKAGDVFSFVDSTMPDDEIQQFLVGETNELIGPQLMAKVVRSSGKDTLCIVMNHMVCDGAGFKDYLYLLGTIYTMLQNGAYGKPEYANSSRSSNQIYKQFSFLERLKIFLLPNEPIKNKGKIYFPLAKGQVNRNPFILTYKLPQNRFLLLKEYSEKQAVTINDIILAAYYRALYKMLEIEQGKSLTIPCMVDLRRYIQNKKATAICNLSSMIMCNIGPHIGQSFDETVKKINVEMNKKKAGFPGLHGLSTLDTLFKFLPFSVVKKIIKQRFANPLIAITNIGIIDSSRLIFGKVPIEDAFVTGSIKYPPYFQLALSSYKSTITFSVNLYGCENDTKLIQTLFVLLDDELKNI